MKFDSPISKSNFRSSACFSSCFGSGASYDEEGERPASLIRSKAMEMAEFGGKCRDIVARIGKHGHRRHKSSGDFRYDPLSYALNFDEGEDDGDVNGGNDLFRYRNFSSRLPPSPVTVERTAVEIGV